MEPDKELQDGLEEQEPFLPASMPEETGQAEYRRRNSVPSTPSRCTLAVLFLLAVVTVFGLCGLALSLKPAQSHSGDDHDVASHDADNEVENHDVVDSKPDSAPVAVQYHEDVLPYPKLRDESEYILDISWDTNAPRTTREYFWTIVDGELNPDGIFRPMMLINNQYPGPLVECNEGDRIILHVENRAVNATSIHFHGIYQNGTNAMDGTVGITQCAIAPSSNFTYTFDIQGQSGTYWYHAHQSAQASDGLLGPVIIHAADERSVQEVDYTTDRIIMIQDHYHNTTAELLMDYLRPDMENDEPVPDNALINGRGVRKCDEFPGWPCDTSNTSTPLLDLAKGQRHRIRIINVGAFAEFQIQFDEHSFYVTEVDGTDVHPEPFHRLNIMPAQRYSLVLETNVTTSDSFWMRSRMVTHCFTTKNEKLQSEIRAIMRYTTPDQKPTDVVVDPASKDWPEVIEVVCRDLNTSDLHPVRSMELPPADDFLIIRANFRIGDWALARGFFNESTWHANTTYPSLHRYLDAGANTSSSDSPASINEVEFEKDKEYVIQTTSVRTVDISINNFDDGSHPFHLHGHKFWVLLQGTSGYPPTKEGMAEHIKTNGLPENPIYRDTVTVEGYAWVVIRVVFDNPGLWAFHCHNTWHAESGMLMQFLVRADVMKDWEVDPVHREMCTREGVTLGERPPDSLWFGVF